MSDPNMVTLEQSWRFRLCPNMPREEPLVHWFCRTLPGSSTPVFWGAVLSAGLFRCQKMFPVDKTKASRFGIVNSPCSRSNDLFILDLLKPEARVLYTYQELVHLLGCQQKTHRMMEVQILHRESIPKPPK